VGNAGAVSIAIQAGLPVNFTPPVLGYFNNDSIGSGTFVGPIDFATPVWAALVPEPSKSSVFAVGLLVLAGFGWRARTATPGTDNTVL
jgi:hypothetical protein